MSVAGLLAFALGQMFTIPLHGLWVVLTALVVTQMSAGGSMRATVEYLIGTLGGAIYGAVIGVFMPHATVIEQAGDLALGIAPLAFIAALNPAYRVAPVSAVLVLLISGEVGGGPIGSALVRFVEVALGGIVAVAVSLTVFPERAHGLVVKASVRILQDLARFVPDLLDGLTRPLDAAKIRRRQDELGRGLADFQATAAEVRHEPFARFVAEPDLGPLSRTLLRLRHDLVILGRAAATPLPDTVAPRLAPLIVRLGSEARTFLHQCAAALSQRRPAPPLAPTEALLRAYTTEVTALRTEGITHALSNEEAERLFALGFALEELHRNFVDLDRCVNDYARRSI